MSIVQLYEQLEDEDDSTDENPLNEKSIDDEVKLRLNTLQNDPVTLPDKIDSLLSKYE